ncbi:hypothetical protein ACJMK2_044091 [Sinanodonta woodiana]|uniref:TLC domain-containing protein n=1 Tax=Sinanodonta woodiana TaxID=1069815 RepID=A0ABD3W2K9_SINWO
MLGSLKSLVNLGARYVFLFMFLFYHACRQILGHFIPSLKPNASLKSSSERKSNDEGPLLLILRYSFLAMLLGWQAFQQLLQWVFGQTRSLRRATESRARKELMS